MYIKKKTHLWPKRRVWRRLGPFSSSFAFVGRLWLLWAFLGLVVIKKLKIKCTLRKRRTYGPNDASGVVWALFRLCGPSLAVVGCCGPSWACVGCCVTVCHGSPCLSICRCRLNS